MISDRPREARPGGGQVIIFRANIAAPNRTPAPAVISPIIRSRRGSVEDSAFTGSTIGLKNSICRAAMMRARSCAVSTC